MATPGYPMGQMPMGAPQMGGPHMGGAAPMPRPVRRGTSKAIPVVISAGLAVGVFCGLLFGVGTGKHDAQAAAPSGNNVKKDAEASAAPAGLGATSTTPKPATPTAPTTPTAPPAGSGAGSATAVAATTPTTPTAPVKDAKKVKLTVNIKPEAAASIAKVSVDGAEIQGMSTDIPGDKKQVKVEVKAAGFKTAEKKLDLVGDEMTLEIELSKKPSGTGGGVHPPKRPDRPPSGGGGLIDI